MWNPFASFWKKKATKPASPSEVAAAILDSVATVGRNVEHWATAQDVYADQRCSEAERATARARCRAEYMNSGYITNAVRKFKTHVVGPHGPQLRLTPGVRGAWYDLTDAEREHIEIEWYYWSEEVENRKKLEDCIGALMYDGEAYLQAIFDPYIDGVELNYQPIESKRIRHPYGAATNPDEIDGIVYDGLHPTLYYVERLQINPLQMWDLDCYQIPAEQMLRLVNCEIIGQRRGLPMMQSVLQMQADLRKWTLYTLGAAEMAARGGAGFIKMMNGLDPRQLESQMRKIAGTYLKPDPGAYKVLPAGWEMLPQDPKFPMTTFDDFSRSVSREVAAGVGSTSGVMLGDTSQYNYSSYKGDRQNYWSYIQARQTDLAKSILDKQFDQFFECQASRDPIFQRIFDALNGRIWRLAREWRFEKPPSVDPQKDAAAWQILKEMGCWSNNLTCAELGIDLKDVLNDLEEEARYAQLTAPPEQIPAPKEVEASAAEPTQTEPPQALIPQLRTAKQLAEEMGIPASQINGWRRQGLRSYKIGGRVLFEPSVVAEFITQKADTKPQPVKK